MDIRDNRNAGTGEQTRPRQDGQNNGKVQGRFFDNRRTTPVPAEFPRFSMTQGKVMDVVEDIHSQAVDFSGDDGARSMRTLRESRLLEVVCMNPGSDLQGYATALQEKYGYSLSIEEIIAILRALSLSRKEERKRLVFWAQKAAHCFAQAAMGKREYFDMLSSLRKENFRDDGGRHFVQEKLAAIMIYVQYPELDKYGDKNILYSLSTLLGKNFYFVMCDALCHVYDFPLQGYKKVLPVRRFSDNMTNEQMKKKLANLEASLSSANGMLAELQKEFDQQLEENKQMVLTDFFAQLNSDRYGNILDQLLAVRSGMEQLRKTGYQLPIEVSGLFIMVKMLIQFIRDSHINPIMRLHQVIPVTAQQVEFCDYAGTPFVDAEQTKKVEVVSPGWVFSDINVQISRPKLREVEENEQT